MMERMRLRLVLACVLAFASSLVMPPARAAEPVIIELFDQRGRRIPGPIDFGELKQVVEGTELLHEWLAEVQSRTGEYGEARFATLAVTLPLSQVSIALHRHMTGNTLLSSVVFHFFKPQRGGGVVEHFRITIFNVRIISAARSLPDCRVRENSEREHEETYGLLYQTVDLSYLQVRYLPGDTNSDLKFDISDPIRLLGFLFSGDELLCPLSGDANGDRKLDISDPISMLAFLFGGGPPPPRPFPACGEALAGESIPCAASACD